MTSPAGADTCPPDMINDLLTYMQGGGNAEHRVSRLIESYPGDGRLHFLHGSMLATARRYEDARMAMQTAVGLSPYLWIARFQLGLLELTSGLPADALRTLAPLGDLASENPLRAFAEGLAALIKDDFEAGLGKLREGIGLNTENPALNSDMQMLIDRTEATVFGAESAEPISATQLLLQTLGRSDPTKH
jgi:tetratricopeptide (TPR) repeat protein